MPFAVPESGLSGSELIQPTGFSVLMEIQWAALIRPLREFKAHCQHLDAGTSARTNETEWFNLQSKSLVSWARETGWLLDTSEFANLTAHLERYEGGSEHLVMFLREQGRVIKVTKNAPCFGLRGDLLDYLLNIE